MQNSATHSTDFDILICGAGLVGASLALALASLPLRIALTETLPLQIADTSVSPRAEGRALALNYASVGTLTALGIWPALAGSAASIAQVRVSERGRFGKLRFTARAAGVDALGYVVPAQQIIMALHRALPAQQNLTCLNPATVTALRKTASGYAATVKTAAGHHTVSARLIVAADGAESALRAMVGITTHLEHTGQSALVTRVTTTQSLEGTAHERFIKQGALALLPLPQQQAALIITGTDTLIAAWQQLSDADFLQRAQVESGLRRPLFTHVAARHVYPLKTLSVSEQVRANFVLLGNAAHTLHPIAAQGFNLGLQDVAALAAHIQTAHAAQQDFAALPQLAQYARARHTAQSATMRFTQNVVSIFAHDWLPLAMARALSLKLLDLLPALKQHLALRLMGLGEVN